MDNLCIWIVLGVISIIFGIVSRIAAYKHNSIAFWFFEGWRDSLGYFIGAIIGYFFIDVRWHFIQATGELSVSDFILLTLFLFAISGWWPYIVKNVSEGIEKILGKIIK